MQALRVANLSLRYGNKTVLNQFAMSATTGELISLVGTSGCGKSTLLKVLAGVINQDEGTIDIHGKPANNAEQRRGVFGYMPQQDALLPWRSLLDNMILGLEIAKTDIDTARQQACELIPLFGLQDRENDLPMTLSGGMRRRAALLRTWLTGNDLLLLDEPFNGLDTLRQRDLQQWLAQLQRQFTKTLIVVTHDLDEAILLADRVLVFAPVGGYINHEESITLSERTQDVMTTDIFIQYKKNILAAMAEK